MGTPSRLMQIRWIALQSRFADFHFYNDLATLTNSPDPPAFFGVANPTFQLAMSMVLRTFIVWNLLPLPKKCKTKTRHRFWLFSVWLRGRRILVEMCPSRIAIMFNCFVIIFASYGYLYMGIRGPPSECTENALETRVQLQLIGKVKPEGKGCFQKSRMFRMVLGTQ